MTFFSWKLLSVPYCWMCWRVMDCTVAVQSAPGEGTTFAVTIPAEEREMT